MLQQSKSRQSYSQHPIGQKNMTAKNTNKRNNVSGNSNTDESEDAFFIYNEETKEFIPVEPIH